MKITRNVRVGLLISICFLFSCREQESGRKEHGRVSVGSKQNSNVHLRVAETPDWYKGLGFDVFVDSIPQTTFAIWPQEAWDYSKPGVARRKWEHVRKVNLKNLVFHPDGTVSYETTKLRRDDVSFKVTIVPGLDQLTIFHEITNRSNEPLLISTIPCVQLPQRLFGGNKKWERAKNVFTVTRERGLTWISDSVQTSGNFAVCPWSQIFWHEFRGSFGKDKFGLSPEQAAVNLAGAVSDDGMHLVAITSEGYPRTAYAWLNCLHATPTKLVEPNETWHARSTIYFSRNQLEHLFDRIKKDFPAIKIPSPNREFSRPGSKDRVLESFEDHDGQAWNVSNGRMTAHQPVQSRFPATHGLRCLDVELDESGVLASPELTCEDKQAIQGNLCFDVMDLTSTPDEKLRQKVVDVPSTIQDVNDTAIRVSISGLEEEVIGEFMLSNGTYRRIVIPIESPEEKADLTVTIRPADSEETLRLRLDCFTFFPSR